MRRITALDHYARAPEERSWHDAETLYVPTDSLVTSEWHLVNTGQTGGTAGIDANVSAVWDDYTGAGVSVGIYDDGVEYTHHDLDGNYDATNHVVIGGVTYSALPATSGESHGTAVA